MSNDEVYAAMFARAGVTIPPERVREVYAGMADLDRLIAVLPRELPAADEPAGIYALASALRRA